MNCPKCDFLTEVIKTVQRKTSVYRLRRCTHCKETFSTTETRNRMRALAAKTAIIPAPHDSCESPIKEELTGEEQEAALRAARSR